VLRTQGSIGFVGSDAYEEYAEEQFQARPYRDILNERGEQLRFALLSRPDTLVQKMIAQATPIELVSSYPRITRQTLGSLGVMYGGIEVVEGSVEGEVAERFELDAAFELV